MSRLIIPHRAACFRGGWSPSTQRRRK
uniref:Uncharacterized protein n=1 Tax=Anguilla anguilla TaxID=7936 RepID=A0A0E9XS43_ANGAN